VQSLDIQMKMVSDNMQDKKQKVRAAESDESFQGNLQSLLFREHFLVFSMVLAMEKVLNVGELV